MTQDTPVMNPAFVLELAGFLETAEFSFDMADPDAAPACGSAGCIGGHAAVLWGDIRENYVAGDEEFTWSEHLLRGKLGITREEHDKLCFLVYGEVNSYYQVTRAGAVATLRRLAETGKVTWKLAEQT